MANTGNLPPSVNLAWLNAIDQTPVPAYHQSRKFSQATSPSVTGPDCAAPTQKSLPLETAPTAAYADTVPAKRPSVGLLSSVQPSAVCVRYPAEGVLHPPGSLDTSPEDGACADILSLAESDGNLEAEHAPALDRDLRPLEIMSPKLGGDQFDPEAARASGARLPPLYPPRAHDASTASANTLEYLRIWWFRLFKARSYSAEELRKPRRRLPPARIIYLIALVMAGGTALGLALNGSVLSDLFALFNSNADGRQLQHVIPTSAP